MEVYKGKGSLLMMDELRKDFIDNCTLDGILIKHGKKIYKENLLLILLLLVWGIFEILIFAGFFCFF